MDPLLRQVATALDSIAETSVIWKKGLLNPGGPHRRLKGNLMPVSIGEDECLVFGEVIRALRPTQCFIIGNAFGFSAAYIASVMRDNGGKRVVTLDSQSEGAGVRCAEIAQKLLERLDLGTILVNKKGWSPKDVPTAVEAPVHELVFIDGDHSHPQVTLDFDAVLPFIDDTSVVAFHDGWIRGIPEAVEHARAKGFRCLWVPTSCEMILGTRDAAMFGRLQALFPRGVEEHAPPSYARSYAIAARELFRFGWDQVRRR